MSQSQNTRTCNTRDVRDNTFFSHHMRSSSKGDHQGPFSGTHSGSSSKKKGVNERRLRVQSGQNVSFFHADPSLVK